MDIEAWVDWARQNLSHRTDYPLIDSTEIDMAQALSEAWASEDSQATLLESYTHQSWSFSKLPDVRNAAAHPSDPFSKEQAEKTYVLCQRVLDILLT